MTFNEELVDWNPSMMLEINLAKPDDFLIVKETIERIGIASKTDNILYQSCHILHKQGRYKICHFKELFLLDGKTANLTVNDIQRRNRIAKLLQDWGLVTIVDPEKYEDVCPMSQIKIISHKQKKDYKIVSKYTLGKKSVRETPNKTAA